jgi:hypothetical protein
VIGYLAQRARAFSAGEREATMRYQTQWSDASALAVKTLSCYFCSRV